ncbi:MAG: efflux RND transporter periplasmic adaptor subunit [Patescibacteria group bacterium]
MLKNVVGWLKNRSRKQKAVLVLLLSVVVWGGYKLATANKRSATQYVTEKIAKGTLITSISGSGSITSGNYNNVNTKASGIVERVYVTNGDTVKKGQKIADITLDDYAKERQTAARVTYLNATVGVKESLNNKATGDIDMWEARQAVLDAQEAVDDMEDNDTNPATHEVYTDGERAIIYKTLDQSRLAFSVAEAKYLNADANIANSRATVDAALRNYQESSASIIAPANGVISDLLLAPGLVLNADSTTSNTSGATIVSAQTIGKISNPEGQLMATTNMSEVDVINIKAGQKVTLTLDAYSDLTFTGKVLAVNTSGSISSGVTAYPVTIILDPVDVEVYPNMAVNVDIITSIKNDVLLVPTTAITITNGESTVLIKKDNKYNTVQVETGSANDSQTEIVSGLTEGDDVVTSVITAQTSSSNSTTSPFSGVGGGTTRSSGNSTRGTFIMQGGPGGF